MEQNISMQQLKEQRLTPPEKFVLGTIKGAEPSKPDKDGNIAWYKDSEWLFTQCFKYGYLATHGYKFSEILEEKYGLNDDETEELLTKLLHKYTNNEQLKVE